MFLYTPTRRTKVFENSARSLVVPRTEVLSFVVDPMVYGYTMVISLLLYICTRIMPGVPIQMTYGIDAIVSNICSCFS